MKVAIFETEHFEAAYPLVKLFDNGRNEIVLFTYPYARRQLEFLLKEEVHRYQWFTRQPGQSKLSFIRTVRREVKKRKIELLYLNTMADHFLAYAWLVRSLPEVRVIVTVHMINAFFETRHQSWLRRWLTARGKQELHRVVKEFNVLSPVMGPVLEQKLPGKTVHSIPGAIYEANPYQQPRSLQNPVRIVVPGSIDGRRRNYEEVIELLQLLEKENMPVWITLAGSFYGEYGRRLLAICKAWKASQQRLIYFEKTPVDQPDFDRAMDEADLVFIPAVLETMIDPGVKETYGLSITSGNMSDVIRHAKPFFAPQQLVMDPLLEQACIRYTAIQDIVDFLLLIHDETTVYEKLQQSAANMANEFTVNKVRERNKLVFLTEK